MLSRFLSTGANIFNLMPPHCYIHNMSSAVTEVHVKYNSGGNKHKGRLITFFDYINWLNTRHLVKVESNYFKGEITKQYVLCSLVWTKKLANDKQLICFLCVKFGRDTASLWMSECVFLCMCNNFMLMLILWNCSKRLNSRTVYDYTTYYTRFYNNNSENLF